MMLPSSPRAGSARSSWNRRIRLVIRCAVILVAGQLVVACAVYLVVPAGRSAGAIDGLKSYASAAAFKLRPTEAVPISGVGAPPAQSLAPYTLSTEHNADLFLRGRQAADWESQVDAAFRQTRFWQVQEERASGEDLRSELDRQKTCLTYQARYAPYAHSTVETVPRPPTPGATTALVIHLFHKDFRPPMSRDLQLHLRALITEVQLGAGIDVFLSVHLGHHASDDLRAQVHADLPSEFQGRTLLFDSQELFGKYVHDQDKIDKLIRVGGLPCENHYTASYFLDSVQGQQYSRMWWLESDVRQTGSWASFFAHVNATIPRDLPPPKPFQSAYRGQFAEWDVQAKGPWQPDYLATKFVSGKSDSGLNDRRGKEAALIFREDLAKAYIHLWGMSRRFHNVLTQYLREGQVADAEYVVPSVAKRHGIPMWETLPPVYVNASAARQYPTYGNWKPDGADPYYRAWHDDPSLCRPGPSLLHAVKAWKAKERTFRA